MIADEGADAFITEPGAFVGLVQDAVGTRNRHSAQAFDLGRHVGCALHQGLLPGARIRPDQRDHPQTDERISLEELRGCRPIYSRIIESYFSSRL